MRGVATAADRAAAGAGPGRVKIASISGAGRQGSVSVRGAPRVVHESWGAGRRRSRPGEWGVGDVADVLYALLLVGGFVVLAGCLRGLERL